MDTSNKNKSIITWVIVIIVVILGIYWLATMKPATEENQTTGETNTSGTTSGSTTSGAKSTPELLGLIMGNPTLGNYLVAENGKTLYYFTKDVTNMSTCTGACAENWPPYTVSATTKIADVPGLKGKIATIERADGSLQLTYKGTPLYYYKFDTKTGDTNGQNVGGTWFVVNP